MKTLLICAVLVISAFSACSAADKFTVSEKAALDKLCDAKAKIETHSDAERAQVYPVLAVIAKQARKNERVTSIIFDSSSHATVTFADGGMHGGGGMELSAWFGDWSIKQKYYFA